MLYIILYLDLYLYLAYFRIAGHADVILEALLKLIVDCCDSTSEIKGKH
jgi:hypothetical protein